MPWFDRPEPIRLARVVQANLESRGRARIQGAWQISLGHGPAANPPHGLERGADCQSAIQPATSRRYNQKTVLHGIQVPYSFPESNLTNLLVKTFEEFRAVFLGCSALLLLLLLRENGRFQFSNDSVAVRVALGHSFVECRVGAGTNFALMAENNREGNLGIRFCSAGGPGLAERLVEKPRGRVIREFHPAALDIVVNRFFVIDAARGEKQPSRGQKRNSTRFHIADVKS
jgi:hypothetical protein